MAQRIVIPGFRKIETSGGGGEGGTTNYNDLANKPSINNVPLVGNLNTVDLKLTDATLTEEGVPANAKTVGTKLEEQSTSLTALSEQLGNHTVKSDVPENAVFTDTVYDDTEVKEEIVNINSNLTSEISRAKETEEVLKSRIDTITSLPEGSTTADAELQDIRVKADGTTATSAGNAVREQVSELKGDLGDLRGHTRNIYEGKMEQGGLSETGQNSSDLEEYFVRTQGYILFDSAIVQEDNQCYLMFSFYSKMNDLDVYFYDENKQYISNAQSSTSGSSATYDRKFRFVIAPNNAKYLRFRLTDGVNKYTPNDIEKIQIEYGYKLTDYIKPYIAEDLDARNEIEKIYSKYPRYTNVFNYLDKDMELGVIYVNGAPVTGQGNYWATTGYIPCSSGDKFSIINRNKWHTWIVYYNKSKVVQGYRNDVTETEHIIPDNPNIKYVRFAVYGYRKSEIAIYKNCPVIPTYIPYNVYANYSNNFITKNGSLNDVISDNYFWRYACGNILFIGDSMTEGYYGDQSKFSGYIKENYPYYVGRMLNTTIYNAGFGGAYPLDWQSHFPDINYTDYDTVFIWLGTNGGMSVNDIDTENTQAYAYKNIVNTVKTSNPDCKIILVKVFITGPAGSETSYPNAAQTNEAIDSIASMCGISDVIDNSDLTYANYPFFHSDNDATHFKKNGNLFIAHRFVEYLKNSLNKDNVEFGLHSWRNPNNVIN